MSSFTFPTKPRRRHFLTLSDGHVYNITPNVEPSMVAENGDDFYCYFDVDPYYKVNDDDKDVLYQIHRKVNDSKYVPYVAGNYYDGDEVYYLKPNSSAGEDAVTPTKITVDNNTKYWSSNGNNEFKFPKPSKNLPHVEVTEKKYVKDELKEYKTIYYFDSMIRTGDKWVESEKVFKPFESEDRLTTYGDKLDKMVMDNLNVNRWDASVNNLPVYVKPDQSKGEESVKSVFGGGMGYGDEDKDFTLGGTIFKDKLESKVSEEVKEIYKRNGENIKSVNVTITVVNS